MLTQLKRLRYVTADRDSSILHTVPLNKQEANKETVQMYPEANIDIHKQPMHC